jgi:hypothetical protein
VQDSALNVIAQQASTRTQISSLLEWRNPRNNSPGARTTKRKKITDFALEDFSQICFGGFLTDVVLKKF